MQEFNTHERDLILEGLRYVRSARKLEFRPTNAPPDPKRVADLEAIATLVTRLVEPPADAAAPAAVAQR